MLKINLLVLKMLLYEQIFLQLFIHCGKRYKEDGRNTQQNIKKNQKTKEASHQHQHLHHPLETIRQILKQHQQPRTIMNYQ